MKQFLINNTINEFAREEFSRNILFDNLERGRLLAIMSTGFELIFIAIDICTSVLKVDKRFNYSGYLVMYSSLIIINLLYLFFINRLKNIKDISDKHIKNSESVIIIYITLYMSWGSILTLMDQKLYGQIIVFLINMLTCSVIYFIDNKRIVIPYIISISILTIGLPFFQTSSDILIGHYVNLFVLVFVSWLASRIIYSNYCNDFNNKILLEKSKMEIEKEVEENKIINRKLELAKIQFEKLAIIDELTGIPNRRGFRNYIDAAFENYVRDDSVLSLILIDIDHFKHINDNNGHFEGDKVLIEVANKINSITRSSMEYFARYGGDEFTYVLFNSNAEDVRQVAERIKILISDIKLLNASSGTFQNISASIGTSSIKITGKETVSKCFKLADKALYSAKNAGRNCVKSAF